jgi:hypothetical protein
MLLLVAWLFFSTYAACQATSLDLQSLRGVFGSIAQVLIRQQALQQQAQQSPAEDAPGADQTDGH